MFLRNVQPLDDVVWSTTCCCEIGIRIVLGADRRRVLSASSRAPW